MGQRTIGDDRVLGVVADTYVELDAYDLDAPAAPDVPEHRYVERGLLGRGGLGEVVEAFDQDLRRNVALKRPREDKLSPRHVAALIKEAQVTAQLEHPAIPPVYTLGFDADQRPYFTMARLSGRTLADLLVLPEGKPERCHLERLQHAAAHIHGPDASVARRLRLLLQVGYALAYAHHHGVLHRDIKPANIMVGDFGEVHLVDWGIARLLKRPDLPDPHRQAVTTSIDSATHVGSFVGTLHYAAPEQIEGRADLDVRADVYALGAVLYAMLAGGAPISGDSTEARRIAALAGDIPRLEPLGIDRRLAAITHKALARQREQRYPNVLALIEDIEAYLDGHEVSALSSSALTRLGRWYFGRTDVVGDLRFADVDAITCSGVALGGAVALALLPWLSPWRWPLVGVGLVFALLMGTPMLKRMAGYGAKRAAPVDSAKARSRGETTHTTLE